ncbi:UNVERIFIED_CONTAM: hypothetical protein Sindi_1477600, partial [Sesamum indicum]
EGTRAACPQEIKPLSSNPPLRRHSPYPDRAGSSYGGKQKVHKKTWEGYLLLPWKEEREEAYT